MSVTIINNQPIRFQNEESIDESCDCLGQRFCQLVNKNDATQFQINLNTIDLVTNGGFEEGVEEDEYLQGWETNGSWQWFGGDPDKAIYIISSGYGALVQEDKLTVGKYYLITFTLDNDNLPYGSIRLDSISGTPLINANGIHAVYGQAISTDIIFTPVGVDPDLEIALDTISIYEVLSYSIKDTDGNTVFTLSDSTGITVIEGTVQYQIDWTEIEEGCYQIHLSDGIINYVSDCVSLKLAHDCSILLSWTNDEDAYGFNYSDLSFTQLLRVKAKKWHPSYPKEKNVFKDNAGNRMILKSETSKEEILTISEMPQYLHDALAIGLEHDDFYVDSVKYTNEETEYIPKWRKSSQLAPSEVVVIKDQLLKNNNC
jgi:hypothetical protein